MDDDKLNVHPDAKLEIVEGFKWYLKRNETAADSFELDLATSFKLIQRNPKAWPSYIHGTQKFVMRHFPFNIVFRQKRDEVEVIAVAHQRRKPGYWRKRLS